METFKKKTNKKYKMLRERTNMDNAENALKVYVKPAKKEGKALYKQGEAICVMYDDDTHEWVGEKDILKMEDGDILSEISEEKLEGHNINVFGYQTQHFDYSEHAKEMFEIAILRVEESNMESKKDALANAAQHLDSILLKAKERNEIGGGLLEKQNIKILIADIQLFSYNNYKSGLEISIDLISNICSDILEFEDEFMGDKVFEYGGEISEYVIVKGYDHFNDKPLYHVISKSEDNDYVGEWHNNLEDAEEELESLKEYGGEMYGKGGEIEDSNNEMLQSQLKAVKHHAEELSNIINDNTPIEAWVVGKIERAATDLSDITHYLDGLEFEMGGEMMRKGGYTYAVENEKGRKKFKDYEEARDYAKNYKGYLISIYEKGRETFEEDFYEPEYFDKGGEMADGGMMAKGGVLKYYDKENEYRLGRPSGSIEKEILEKVTFKESMIEKNFVGNFGWKTPQGKLGDGYLYSLDEYDQNLVKDLKLKDGEKIFRYVSRTTAIGGMTPMIKINLDKELIYFLIHNDNDEIVFETKGTPALWIGLIQHKIAMGGEMKWGGRVTFKEKVEAITESLNGRKVKPKYKKEYGNTYDKKEAKQAATKIVGALVKKEKMAKGGKVSDEEKIRLAVYEFLTPLGYSAKVENLGNEIHIEPSTSKVGNNRKDFFDGMQIHRFKDGTYEVSEYQAGKNEDELYIYKETKSLTLALKDLIKGNKRKPIKKYAKGGQIKSIRDLIESGDYNEAGKQIRLYGKIIKNADLSGNRRVTASKVNNVYFITQMKDGETIGIKETKKEPKSNTDLLF